MLKEGKEACLLFPMSLELSVVDPAMILWWQNYGSAQLGERDESAREDSRLVRRSPDVVMSARSKKSSAVNILEEDLLDLQLLWSSIQGRG